MTPTTALQALPSNLTRTDIAQCYREATGATRFSETDEIFARLIERRVHELADLSAPAQDAQADQTLDISAIECHLVLNDDAPAGECVIPMPFGIWPPSSECVSESKHEPRPNGSWANQPIPASRTQPATPAQDTAATVQVPFKPETWPVDADGFAPSLCTECGTPVRYGSRHSDCGRKALGLSAATPPAAPQAPNPEEVICPACVTQFRAIPTQVQDLLLAAGYEPPFLGGAQAAQPAGMVPLTDAQIDGLPWHPQVTVTEGLRDFAREVERAHGITPAATKEQSNG